MSPGVKPDRPDCQGLVNEPVLWSRSLRNPRPLTIGSASHYAQEHSLTLDFYAESSKRAATHLISLKDDSQNGEGRGLTSYSHLAQCTIPAPSINDCWVDTKPSIQYLQQLLPAAVDPFGHSMQIPAARYLTAKSSRCEFPILRSDNNLDLLGLVHDIHSRRAVPLAETAIPRIETDMSGDEGLRFPCWSDQLMKHFDNHLSKEGPRNWEDSQLPEDAGLYGTTDVGKPDKEEICALIVTEFMAYKEYRPSGAVFSSPILPSQFTYDVFVPDSEACVINCFSDTTTLLDNDIKQVESRLTAEHDGEDTLHSELQTPPESSPVFPAPVNDGPRISSMKVEVPLTNSIERRQDGREDMVLKDVLNSLKPLCGEARATVTDLGKMSDQVPFLTSEIAIQLQDACENTHRQMEQERLDDPGSSRRVAVPVMDFTRPEPEWKKLTASAASHFKSFSFPALEIITKQIKNDAREERKLRWRPLNGSSGKLSLTERITVDSEKLELLLYILGDAEADEMKLECLFARRTLRFLRDPADGNEEIELSPIPKQTSLSLPSANPPTDRKRTQKSPDLEESSLKIPKSDGKNISSGGFALLDEDANDGVGGLLTSYLQIRAPEKTFPTMSTHFSRQTEGASIATSPRFQNAFQTPRGNQAPGPQAQRLPTLFPEFDPRETGSRYVVSAVLGKPVVRQLDWLCPTVKLYLRDFSNHTKPTGASGTRGSGSPLVHEADIALSSSTGVICTTLAQLRHKSLPGERQTQLRQKMQTVSTMYEKIIVLISLPEVKWTSDDTRAYTDFVAFANTLDSTIETILIGNNQDCLGKWIICLMNEYRYEGRKNEHLLVQEETSWEVFFRLGGMNVYAAQVLAGFLNAAYGSQGLARLVAMGSDERVSTFGAIIGTRRPLDNLSSWASKERI